MDNIHVMPDALANKIAAGEVVERPSSVVKELMENSIDAGSSVVNVELREAGLEYIRIADNGKGMEKEDAVRAFQRHATSKIRDERDLFHVKTLGFRGEALASIAAVSKLSVKTSTGDTSGISLYLEGGEVKNHEASDARQGTEIKVEELFFNTPARLKYMKTIHTELGHVTDVVNRMALANPHVKVSLEHQGKTLFQTSGRGDQLQVLSQIYGSNVARKMKRTSAGDKDFKLEMLIGRPEITRASRAYMSLIVNGRFIRNPKLVQAILKGYDTLLPLGKYPVALINIDMDPSLLDVNVHPAKLEVRFSKEQELFELIQNTIKQAFREETLIPEGTSTINKKEDKREQTSMVFEKPRVSEIAANSNQSYETERIDESTPGPEKENPFPLEPEPAEETVKDSGDIRQEEEENTQRVPHMYPVGQLHGTYIIAQNERGMYMIDQHAAQERIKYERFKKKLGEPDQTVQELLVPLTFTFPARTALKIEENSHILENIGVFFESFGTNTFIVRSHPEWFPKGYEGEIIEEIVEELEQSNNINIENFRNDAAALMSCKGSIKANHHLTPRDMEVLLDDLAAAEDPFTCPHGRPIIVFFSEYDIEKMFKRVMN
ncbi:DNA mismatch repair protein MutL [Salimicrobium jeotgali]|uniref:DNA mismatch repair protein MutL n=1 Tax=Salimicrobium jeotgali TaxID=1230341 RepID=K2FPD6_9BACI|nr:DNA mismatch repair endonuclease MutL [Salimicrobium jeotgali]AKG04515.1 DNA mismatch repair protein MutL [Salimicrobium jeotgali]EKE32726.1 DNA mismatch repair protein [Salimicrobium jeotgali]MBM7695287.1 DNA mismatch repair protein MutL [Salimicrobium jeotgali]